MKLRFLLTSLLGLISTSLFAQSIQVEYGFNAYSLNITKDEVTFTKKEYSATVKKEKCSTKLFDDYVSRFSDLSKEQPKDQTTGSEFLVKYKIDNKEGILTPGHEFAQKLLGIPSSFDVFKLATEFRCE